MSITSSKITTTSVLAGASPSKALPVISNDFNPVIDDLTSIDKRIGVFESGILTGGIIQNHTASVINSTATATTAQIATGYITSTSAAATSITLPTAALLATTLGAKAGTSFEFIVDNTAGANTVTVVVGSNIVAATPVITGGATLTVAASSTQGIGIFRLVFSSATAAVLFRIG